MNLLQDLRFAGRMLIKDRWFTMVAATALALGIGVNTTVFTFVNAVLIRGLPFDRPEEIVYLATHDTTRSADDNSAASWHEFEDWRAKSKSFVGIAAFRNTSGTLSDTSHPAERFQGAMISANTFGLLRQQPFLGRDFAPGDDAPGAAPVALIGYQIWKNRYSSDPTVIGRPLKLNDVSYTVIGIMPEGLRFPTNADVWRPIQAPAADAQHNRNVGVFARLAPGIGWDRAAAEMAGISTQLQSAYPDNNKNIEGRLMTFNERFNGGPIRLVFLSLLGAVGFVLLIACANVANLLLARSAYRAREMALRTALGASRMRIVRQLLIESVLLACIGGLMGLGLTVIGIRLFDAAVENVGKPYWIRFALDLPVFGYFAAVSLATGVVFGLAPAMQVSKTNLNDLMKEGGRGNAGGNRARWLTSGLVVAELALTLTLLTGAGLMARSFLKLYSLDLGFETNHLLTMRTQLLESKYPKPEQRQVFFDTVQARLASLPGVTAAGLASTLPFGGTGSFKFELEGRAPAATTSVPRVSTVDISPTYFDVLGVSLLRGRAFSSADGSPGSEVIIINQRLAAQFGPNDDPLGRRLRLLTGEKEDKPGPWLTIVGISPAIRQGDPQALEPAAVLYQPYRLNSPTGSAILVRTSAEPTTMIATVREAIRNVDQDQPVFAVQTLNAALAEARWPYRVFGSMFVLFALIALLLSSLGIYSITAYSVTRRTQEIGVRMALGAQAPQISWLIVRTGLWQLGIGLALGLMGAYGVSQLLSTLVAQIPAVDPVTFVGITALLVAVTLTACFLPARRATKLDPLAALRID